MLVQWIIVSGLWFFNIDAYIDKDVVDCLKDNGLTNFVQLIDEVSLTKQLTEPGPFTVLAPTNAAWHNLDADLLAALTKDPSVVKQVVYYHIIPDFGVLPDLASKGEVNSLEGQPITFSGSVANMVINNSSRPIAGNKSDIVCNNGVVHIIDEIILPPVFSINNLATVLVLRDDIFRDMFMVLLLNNLTDIIEGSEFTLFAPTDLAFGRYSELTNIRPDMPNSQRIYYEVFKYHMVPGRRTSHQLRDGDMLYTLHGYPVEIGITASGMKIDHANIVETDIPASNGVIHAIDHIIFPTDLLDQLTGAAL